MQTAPRSQPTAPHYAKAQLGDYTVTVAEMANEGVLLGDEYDRIEALEVRFVMDLEHVEYDPMIGRGYVIHTPRLVGAALKGRYLSPRQCAEILPREIRVEAAAAAEREANNLTDNS